MNKIKELMNNMTDEELKELGLSRIKEIKKEELQWIPKINEDYWYIFKFSCIHRTYYTNYEIDNYRISCGNIYKTKEIAEKVLSRLGDYVKQTFIQIQNYVDNNDDGWGADWEDTTQYKYYLAFNHTSNKFELCCIFTKYECNVTYMSENMANKILNIINNVF